MDSNINIWDIHADYKLDGFRAYGTYAEAKRSDALELAGTLSQVKAKGGYINLS